MSTFPDPAGDTANNFVVAVPSARPDVILVMGLARRATGVAANTAGPLTLTKAEALNLAAWLAVLADPGRVEFNRVVEGIEST